jgi:hypothetical protein
MPTAPSIDAALPEWPRGGWLLRRAGAVLLNDPRDVVYLGLLARLTLLPIVAAALFAVRPLSWILVAIHVALVASSIGPFVTGFHDLTHHVIFKRRYRWLNHLAQWVLSTLMGSPPMTFFSHHVAMHHVRNNGPTDVHSTMPYQRDSFRDFSVAYLRLFFGAIATARWHWRRGHKRLVWQTLGGEGFFWVLTALLGWIHWQATVVCLVLPLFVCRTLFIVGNWAEHAFVDPLAPANIYRMSTNILGKKLNEEGFNVGYHIGHTLRPHQHCAELPAAFRVEEAEYGRQDAIVFERTNFPVIWWCLMWKRHEGLARKMVQLEGAPVRTVEERVAELRRRLVPIR